MRLPWDRWAKMNTKCLICCVIYTHFYTHLQFSMSCSVIYFPLFFTELQNLWTMPNLYPFLILVRTCPSFNIGKTIFSLTEVFNENLKTKEPKKQIMIGCMQMLIMVATGCNSGKNDQ